MSPRFVSPTLKLPTSQTLHAIRCCSLVVVGLCIAVSISAQTATQFRVQSWQPAGDTLTTYSKADSVDHSIQPQQTISAHQQICLKADKASQTLVQVQPAEGGEARFITLGGQGPRCQMVGHGWASAKSGETLWYKTLFTQLGVHQGGFRISASTSGATRGRPDEYSSPETQNPCGLYPTAKGLIYVVSGQSKLTLGSTLPPGTSVLLVNTSHPDIRISAKVVESQIRWSGIQWTTGDRWQVVYDRQASTHTNQGNICEASIVVQSQASNPIQVARSNAPSFSADESTVHATLVAAQLEDPNLAVWHAWLLSSIEPDERGVQDIGTSLWKAWWRLQ